MKWWQAMGRSNQHCPHGHVWDSPDGVFDQGRCPVCGAVATESGLPRIDPHQTTKPVPPAGHPSPPPGPAPIPVAAEHLTFEGLEVIEELAPGVGGMGVVYKARETSLDRIVAVKTTKAHLRNSEGLLFFLREARAAAQLDHPHILRIHRFVPEHDPPFYIMQFVEGRPLDVACRGRNQQFVAGIIEKVARALEYAHGRGVIHRDIKPGNILVDLEGEPHIADFGLALRHEDIVSGNGGCAVTLGTPSYIPPEVYEKGTGSSPGLDIYALGITLYQLLVRRLPFVGGTLAEIRAAVLRGEPPLPTEIDPSIPEPLQRICLKAIERSDRDRYETARAMGEDLRRFLEGKEVFARPTRYQEELRGKLRNHLTEIRMWGEQRLIEVHDMDRLSRPYRSLLEISSPWWEVCQRFPCETVMMRIGAWLVLLSGILWPVEYWDQMDSAGRLVSIGVPVVALSLAGWFLLRQRFITGIYYLCSGALLLPVLVATILAEYRILSSRFDDSRDLFSLATGPPASAWGGGGFAPTNHQCAVAAGAFSVYALLLLAITRSRTIAFLAGCGIYLLAAAALLVEGFLPEIREGSSVIPPGVFLAIAAAFWPAAIALERRSSLRHLAGIVFAFFPVPFAVATILIAWTAPTAWWGKPMGLEDPPVFLSLLGAGAINLVLALAMERARTGCIRSWSWLHELLSASSLLIPAGIVFLQPDSLALGRRPFSLPDLALGIGSLGLAAIGIRLRKAILLLSALAGLAAFVFHAAGRHFPTVLAWPLGLAVAGAVFMGIAVIGFAIRTPRPNADGSRPRV